MLALLLAAQLSAEIVRPMPVEVVLPTDPVAARIRLVQQPQEVFGRPRLACPSQGAMQTSDAAEPALLLRPQDRRSVRLKRLGDLPKANKEIAVERSIGGCAVPVAIRYGVEGDGRFASGAPGKSVV